jgi:hypothetical protein
VGLVSSFRFMNPNGASFSSWAVFFSSLTFGLFYGFPQVAETLGDKVRIVKVDTDAEPTLASQLQVSSRPCCSDCVVKASDYHVWLVPCSSAHDVPRAEYVRVDGTPQIQGLPTVVFVGLDKAKPALRTEGLLPAERIIDIINNL